MDTNYLDVLHWCDVGIWSMHFENLSVYFHELDELGGEQIPRGSREIYLFWLCKKIKNNALEKPLCISFDL